MSNYNPAGGGLQYRGTAASAPPNCNFSKVDPTTGNKHNVSLLDFWLNVVSRDVFVLVALTTLNGATWVKLSSGGGGGVASVIGGHDINITGTATNPIVNVNNSITLGDLSPIAPTDYALIAVTGSIAIGNGSLRLPATSSLFDGIIYLGSTSISNYGEANIFIGESSGNVTLSIPDAQFNCGFGASTCKNLTTGFGNTLLGGEAGLLISSGSNNTAVGYSSLYDDNDNTGNSTGSNNIAVGSFAASALKSSESNNIIVGNNGVTGDNNIIRIGTQGSGAGQQDECFVAGIVGVTTSNSQMVTIDSTTGQLGAATLPTGSGALTLLQTQVASSATELDFTTGITSTYNNYLILGSNITAAAVGLEIIQLQVSTDGGLTYDTTNYTSGFSTVTTGMDYAVSNDNTQYTFSPYYLTNVTSGSGYILGAADTNFFDTSGSTASTSALVDAYTVVNTTVNAFRLISFTGGAFSGTFSLYGYSF